MKFTYKNGKTHTTVDEINPKASMYTEIPNAVHKYAHDVLGNPITAPDGYELILEHCEIKKDFIHFDIYGGWTKGSYDYQVKNGHHICRGQGGYSDAMGRWICWAKPIKT